MLQKTYSGSLLYRLLGSFAVVIVLLVSFNVLTYTFFVSNIRQEIIKNSSLNLNTTAVNYEKHIALIKSMMIGFYFNNKTEILKNDVNSWDYYIASQVQKELQNTLKNTQLYLHNVLYYYPSINYVIDKDGARPADTMFAHFIQADAYSAAFWKEESQRAPSFHVYPASDFKEQTSFSTHRLGTFNPILFKSARDPDFAMIAFLDSTRMYDSFSQIPSDRNFYIVDDSNQTIFSASKRSLPNEIRKNLSALPSSGYELKGTDYYFYLKSAETGFTYILAVPFASISDQITRLNLIMIILLAVSIIISIAVSVFFSVRFNNPLTAIIQSIQQVNTEQAPTRSRIMEFNVISEKLYDLFKKNEDIHKDLHVKNSLLQQFAYLSKVKMIHTNIQDVKIPIDTDKPYQLLLFQLMFKERLLLDLELDANRASYYIKEFIHSVFMQSFPDSVTFQIEKDQILTILFTDCDAPDLTSMLGKIKDFLAPDADYYDVSVAVSPLNTDSMDFNSVFEHVSKLLKQRQLGEGVQVIDGDAPSASKQLWFPQAKEKDFTANLATGNDAMTIPLVMKLLEQACKEQATFYQMYDLSKEIENLIVKSMVSLNLPLPYLNDQRSSVDLLKDCRTLGQFQDFFRNILTQSATAVQQKKTNTDYITSFVMNYVEDHFGGDLSLELIAEKLNITGTYLSTYFKEKNDMNFSDYIHTFRMNKAMELLQKTDLKIQDVAGLVGYYTVASFNRMFKKHTGMTPSEFRRSTD
jgi:two-component system response regulator YesN